MERHVGQVEAYEAGERNRHAVDLLVDAYLVDDRELHALHADVDEGEGEHENHDGDERARARGHEYEDYHEGDNDDEAVDEELEAAYLVAYHAGDGRADKAGAVVLERGEGAGEGDADAEHGGEVGREVAAADVEAVDAEDDEAEEPDARHFEDGEYLLRAGLLLGGVLGGLVRGEGVDIGLVEEGDEQRGDDGTDGVENHDGLERADVVADHEAEGPERAEVHNHAADAVEALKPAVELALVLGLAREADGLEAGGPEYEDAGDAEAEVDDEGHHVVVDEEQVEEAEYGVAYAGHDQLKLRVESVGEVAAGDGGYDARDDVDTEGEAYLRVVEAAGGGDRVVEDVLDVRQQEHGRIEEAARQDADNLFCVAHFTHLESPLS